MLITIESIIDLVLQSIMIIIIINSCVKKGCNRKNKDLISIILILSLLSIIIKYYNSNDYMHMIYNNIIYIVILGLVYRKDIIKAEISYLILYLIIRLFNIISINIIVPCLDLFIIPSQYMESISYSIIYIIDYLFIYYLLRYKTYVIKLNKLIINNKLFITTIILINIVNEYNIIFSIRNKELSNPLVKNIIIINIFIFFILSTIYFSKMKKETEQINKLNEALDIKNEELRKIKHDYGAEISYLYGLYLMNREEKLGDALKSILKTNNDIKSAVQINYNSQNKLISTILTSLINNKIHIIIEDNAMINSIKMPKEELHTILESIIKSVRKNNGFIIIKTQNSFDKLIINIENNINEINQDNKYKFLFKRTNIDNKLLSIAEDLIEKYDGSIYTRRAYYSTEFKITLPLII